MEICDAQAKADEIETAVYDLKAVNPNIVKWVEERTTEKVIGSIEYNNIMIQDSLINLKNIISDKLKDV